MTDRHTHPLIGHDAALRDAQTAFASGRMHHAWLIAGSEGIGKATLARQIARFILTGGGADGKAERLVDAETHPDMLVIRRPVDDKTGALRATIPVEETLKISAFLRKTATHGGWRIVILDEAHALNRNGQNAILKIVEEPPPQTLILITVTTPGALLPTIRSRCRLMHLSPLSPLHMREALATAAPGESPDDLSTLIDLAGGSVGFALKILRTETLPLYREMLGMLDAMPPMDTARVHKLADQVARKADSEAFDVLTMLLVERLRRLAHEEAARHPAGRVDQALQIYDKTRATLAAADYANLDRKLAFINAMTDIQAVCS